MNNQDMHSLMAKVEGDIYELVAANWFKEKGYTVLEHRKAKHPDFKIKLPDGQVKIVEVKGRNLIYVDKKSKRLLFSYIALSNIGYEEIDIYLIIIYDNFADLFRIFEIPKDQMDILTLDHPRSLHFYDLFNLVGFDKVFFKVEQADLKKKRVIKK